jgi:hypothetical protein
VSDESWWVDEDEDELRAEDHNGGSPEMEAEVEGDIDIRTLRERARRYDEAQAALPALKRENALMRSGVDLESPLGQLFVKGYDGELTAEAIRAEAERYGIPHGGQKPSGARSDVG